MSKVTLPAVALSPGQAVALRYMVTEPRGEVSARILHEALGVSQTTANILLRKLTDAGWMVARQRPADHPLGGGFPRSCYVFTQDGLEAAKAELKTWTFTD